MSYFQLGGFRPSLKWFKYDDKRLAETVVGDHSPLRQDDSKEPVELTLGIRTSGASCLLLTEKQVSLLCNAFPSEPYPYPRFRPTDFESLSPLAFHDAEQLRRKLTRLTPKKTKVDYDTSQANREYAPINGSQTVKVGPSRALFEHNRLFYRLIQGTIDCNKFSLNEGCRNCIKIVSLVYNSWSMDKRSLIDRRQSPKILDIGLTVVSGSPPTLADRTSHHFVPILNKSLDPGKRKAFTGGMSVDTSGPQLASSIDDLIRGSTEKPVILLVFDAPSTLQTLESLGLQTSQWTMGIKDLVYDFSKGGYPSQRRSSYRDEPLPHYRSRSRSPSRSYRSSTYSSPPQRQSSQSTHYNSYSSPSSSRYSSQTRYTNSSYIEPTQSPTPISHRRSYDPIYVVDVEEMYVKMRQIGAKCNIYDSAEYTLRRDMDRSGFCAGDESSLLIDVWESLASGNAIDDQRNERSSLNVQSENVKGEPKEESTNKALPVNADADDDDDWDPNDEMDREVEKRENGAVLANPYDDIYNDEDDYGDDIDDD